MGKIIKDDSNIFPIPTGATVTRGYVYLNVSSQRKINASGKSVPTHDRIAIGVVAAGPGEDWREKRLMYANRNFHDMCKMIEEREKGREESSVPPELLQYFTEAGLKKVKNALQGTPPRSNNINVPELCCQKRDEAITIGLFLVVQKIASKSGLINILVSVFGETTAMLLLDLALYAIDKLQLVYQFLPGYARDHAIFSDVAYNDDNISHLLLKNVTLSKINLFKFLWAIQVLERNEHLYLCYDSTNVNCQCDSSKGIELVQEEHVKDRNDLTQVNPDYIIRQSDGLPVSFNTFPGSIPDISEAEEMFAFFETVQKIEIPEECEYLFKGTDKEEFIKKKDSIIESLDFIFDRGYISEKNIEDLGKNGFGYLLLLRGDTKLSRMLISKHYHRVKSRRYEIERGLYGDTVQEKLFDNDEKTHYCHIIYDENLRDGHEIKLRGIIAGLEAEIKSHIKRKTILTQTQLNKYLDYFMLETDWVFTDNRRNANKSTKVIIKSYREDYEKIDHATEQCGFFALISSRKISVEEAIKIYRNRDIVEKTYLRLKSFLGMTCFRGHSAESIHIRSLIWFLSSIIYSQIFSLTSVLRADERNRKKYSVQAIIESMQHVKTIFNFATSKYNKAYEISKDNRLIFNSFDISEDEVYEFAASIDLEMEMGSDD